MVSLSFIWLNDSEILPRRSYLIIFSVSYLDIWVIFAEFHIVYVHIVIKNHFDDLEIFINAYNSMDYVPLVLAIQLYLSLHHFLIVGS